ncbi:unnamed protein product [Caenorhabditis angaria]|uniref:ZP domain-containing protein n=1 Tax=Caenorhabditis angaria TaxID=860376 RepID=A0A9P1NAZ3_9PELO|nr:unnamed protein product [Caenorhabditis angaria]
MIILLIIFILLLPNFVAGEIDNAIVGDPTVDCGDDFFEVKFETRTQFHGIAFVQNHLDNPDCRSFVQRDNNNIGKNSSLRLSFDQCAIDKRLSVSCFRFSL